MLYNFFHYRAFVGSRNCLRCFISASVSFWDALCVINRIKIEWKESTCSEAIRNCFFLGWFVECRFKQDNKVCLRNSFAWFMFLRFNDSFPANFQRSEHWYVARLHDMSGRQYTIIPFSMQNVHSLRFKCDLCPSMKEWSGTLCSFPLITDKMRLPRIRKKCLTPSTQNQNDW